MVPDLGIRDPSVCNILIRTCRVKIDILSEIDAMYYSLFDAVITDYFFSIVRTVYVVSTRQPEEIKRNQKEAEQDESISFLVNDFIHIFSFVLLIFNFQELYKDFLFFSSL